MEAYRGLLATAQPPGTQARSGTTYKQPSTHPQSPQRYSTLPLQERYHTQRSDTMQGSQRRYPAYPMQGYTNPLQYGGQPGQSISAAAGSRFTGGGYHQIQHDPTMARKPRDQNVRVHFEPKNLRPTTNEYMQPRLDEIGGGERRRPSRHHHIVAPATFGAYLHPTFDDHITQPHVGAEDIVGSTAKPQDRHAPPSSHPLAHAVHTEVFDVSRPQSHRQRQPQHSIAPTPSDTPAPPPPSKDRTKYGKSLRVPEVELRPELREVGRTEAKVARERRERRSAMPLSEMEEDLSCPICMSIMVAAHAVSPCGHTLCGGCAYEWIRENQTCAICRKSLTEGNGLIPIHSLDALVERYVKEKGGTWDGLEEFKEKKEIWEAQRTIIREEESARAPAASDTPRLIPVVGRDSTEDLVALLRAWNSESPPLDSFHRTFAGEIYKSILGESLQQLMEDGRPDDFFVPPTARHIHTGRQIPDSAFAEMLSFIDTLHDHDRFNPHHQHFNLPQEFREPANTSFTLNFGGQHARDPLFQFWAHGRNGMDDGMVSRMLSAVRGRL